MKSLLGQQLVVPNCRAWDSVRSHICQTDSSILVMQALKSSRERPGGLERQSVFPSDWPEAAGCFTRMRHLHTQTYHVPREQWLLLGRVVTGHSSNCFSRWTCVTLLTMKIINHSETLCDEKALTHNNREVHQTPLK